MSPVQNRLSLSPMIERLDTPEKEKDFAASEVLQPVVSLGDPRAEARLVRYLDVRVLPLVISAFLLTFLDRANIGNARSAGLVDDLKLGVYDYNSEPYDPEERISLDVRERRAEDASETLVGGSLYYLFYFLMEMPAGLLVKRYGTVLVPLTVIVFGIVTLGTTWIHNRSAFFAIRILLGLAEGFVTPGISYMLSQYYRRQELTLRFGYFLLVAAGLSQAFGSLLAAGLINLGSVGNVKGWRIIFLVEGILTIGLGVILTVLWPKEPEKTKMLNEEQRTLLNARILADSAGAKVVVERTSWSLVKRALRSPTSLVCAFIYLCDQCIIQGLALFAPTILKTTYPGRTIIQINLLAAPLHIVAATTALVCCWTASRYKRHYYSVVFGCALGIVGYGIWIGTTSKDANVRYGAIYLIAISGYVNGPVVLGWAMSNVSPASIRATTSGMIPAIACIGSIASPWMFISTTAPAYRPGNITNITLQIACLLATGALVIYQLRENRKRDRGERDYRLEQPDAAELGYQHPKFRYII